MANELNWVTAHAAAHYETVGLLPGDPSGKTLCAQIFLPIAARRLRVALCERYGTEPAICAKAVLGAGDKRYALTFKQQHAALVLPGQELYSDPIDAAFEAGETLALWLYFADKHTPRSRAALPTQISPAGDFCGAEFPPPTARQKKLAALQNMFCYARLEAETDEETACAVAAFGDSITAMGHWTGPLSQKLFARGGPVLLNLGISGNRVLTDTDLPFSRGRQVFGRAALTRFSWDVAALPGVRAAIIALGVNDISQPGAKRLLSPDAAQRCTSQSLISGLEKLALLCKDAGIKSVGCTITPFGGYLTYNENTARIRNEVNAWILHGGAFDRTADFASALCDPQRPDFMLPALDSGDNLHPGEAGGARMADAVDIDALVALVKA